MVTISLCMIVRNEENTLPICLDSVRELVDEIIIVDTGSADRTKKIAYEYTDKVFEFQWIDDFSAARNYSFSKATKDFILWLDADDIIMDEDKEAFKKLKNHLSLKVDVVIMKYVLRRDQAGKETYSCYRERLVKRENNFEWQEPVHENLEFAGSALYTEVAITHTKLANNVERNLKLLKKVINSSKVVKPRHFFYYARESEAVGNTEEAIHYYLKFLEEEKSEIAPYVEACIQLAQIYMNKNEEKKALKILIQSFEYGYMCAEVLCFIGKYYLINKDYVIAIHWYELALSLTKPIRTLQFFMQEYWDFIPCIELCHCYYHIGDLYKALEYHYQSERLKPYHDAVLENQKFFSSIKVIP